MNPDGSASTTDATPSMKPCPFCGATEASGHVRVGIARYVTGWYETTACCEKCGTFRSTKRDLDEGTAVHAAIVDWNTRTGTPS